MNLVYTTLFEVHLRHTYYTDGGARGIRVVPTPGCRRILDRYGLIFRTDGTSFAVAARVEPDTDPPVLRQPFGSENIAFRFLLQVSDPLFLNGTNLPNYDGQRTLYYFDNLRDDREDSRRYLGDSSQGQRMGSPIGAVFRSIYIHRFDVPQTSAVVELHDRFGTRKLAAAVDFAHPGEAASAYVIDLSSIPDTPAGRYTVSDNHGGRESFYYDPSLRGRDVFGLLEIYNRTDALTPNQSNEVPPEYRFVDKDRVTGKGVYALEFTPRATIWRFIVTKIHENNGIALQGLSITGGVTFSTSSVPGRVIFTSDGALPLQEQARGFQLEHDSTKLRTLPEPKISSPLHRRSSIGDLVSDQYIYL